MPNPAQSSNIRHMKITFIACFGVTLLMMIPGVPTPSHALPVGEGNFAGEYVLSDQDLSKWSIGLYYLDREREMDVAFRKATMQTEKVMAYIGYDVLFGVMPYITVGSIETTFKNLSLTDSHVEAGLGLHINFLDHEIPDPTLLEDRIKISGSLQYTKSGVTWAGKELDWDEIYGTCIISIVNDINGLKTYWFEGIGVYFGAVYSELLSSSVDNAKTFGTTAGVNLFYSERVLFEFGIENIDSTAMQAGIHIRL